MKKKIDDPENPEVKKKRTRKRKKAVKKEIPKEERVHGSFKFKTAKEFSDSIEKYFNETLKEQITVTGMILSLGFAQRKCFYAYLTRKGFEDLAANALLRCENSYEMRLVTAKNPTGSIFALKNMGWKDNHTIEHKGEIKFSEIIAQARKRMNSFVNKEPEPSSI